MRRGKNLARLSLAIVITAGAGVAVWMVMFRDRPVHHFGVVREGVLYRGGQPDDDALREIIASHRIRTVVNLASKCTDQEWWIDEDRYCRANGVRLLNLPIGDDRWGLEGLREFLTAALDRDRQPMFVHCEHGSNRTGYVVAAYRIAIDGWSFEDAVREAARFRFNPESEYVPVLKRLAAGADWRTLTMEDGDARRPEAAAGQTE